MGFNEFITCNGFEFIIIEFNSDLGLKCDILQKFTEYYQKFSRIIT